MIAPKADCVDLQPAAAWHDDEIRTTTRFQAFVKHRHVKANQKTYTQRNKTFDTKCLRTNTSPKAPAAHCGSYEKLENCALCRANVFIKLLEKLHYFQFLHFYTPPTSNFLPYKKEANSKHLLQIFCSVFFFSALSGVVTRDFTQQKTNMNTAAFFMRQQPHE